MFTECRTNGMSYIYNHTWRRFGPTVAEGRLLSVHNSTTKQQRLDIFGKSYSTWAREKFYPIICPRILRQIGTNIIYLNALKSPKSKNHQNHQISRNFGLPRSVFNWRRNILEPQKQETNQTSSTTTKKHKVLLNHIFLLTFIYTDKLTWKITTIQQP